MDRAFAYNCPAEDDVYFFPRESLCREFIQCIEEPGTQPLVYGESGVGKTSAVRYCLRRIKKLSAQVPCSHDVTEQTLIPVSFYSLVQLGVKLGQITETGVKVGGRGLFQVWRIVKERLSSSQGPTMGDLVRALRACQVVLVFENIDRVADKGVNNCLGNMAKVLSDGSIASPAGQLVLSITARLAGQVPRCLSSPENGIRLIEVPRMTGLEVEGLIRHGMRLSRLKLAQPVIEEIVRLSRGIPRVAKLLCLETGRALAHSVRIKDQRLFGDEPEVDAHWFRAHIQSSSLVSHEYLAR